MLLIPHAYPRLPCNSPDITVERCRYQYNGFIAMQICLRYVRYILTILAYDRGKFHWLVTEIGAFNFSKIEQSTMSTSMIRFIITLL